MFWRHLLVSAILPTILFKGLFVSDSISRLRKHSKYLQKFKGRRSDTIKSGRNRDHSQSDGRCRGGRCRGGRHSWVKGKSQEEGGSPSLLELLKSHLRKYMWPKKNLSNPESSHSSPQRQKGKKGLFVDGFGVVDHSCKRREKPKPVLRTPGLYRQSCTDRHKMRRGRRRRRKKKK